MAKVVDEYDEIEGLQDDYVIFLKQYGHLIGEYPYGKKKQDDESVQ